jgi:hypothetical protein
MKIVGTSFAESGDVAFEERGMLLIFLINHWQ